jgi:hypothetical protein
MAGDGHGRADEYADRISHRLKEELLIWRLVTENIASLNELESTWNLDDLHMANAVLDMRMDITRAEHKKSHKALNDSSKVPNNKPRLQR